MEGVEAAREPCRQADRQEQSHEGVCVCVYVCACVRVCALRTERNTRAGRDLG